MVVYIIAIVAIGIFALAIKGLYYASIAEQKGYDGFEWFLKGIFAGRYAFFELATLKENKYRYKYNTGLITEFEGGWTCKKCGTNHPSYTGTCSCGNSKYEQNKKQAEVADAVCEASQPTDNNGTIPE